MAFTEVQDLDSDKTTALGGFNKTTGKANPTKAEGYFIGSKDVASKKARSGFAKLHILQTEDGKLGIWGKTDLDRKMQGVTPGTMVRITQNGKQATPNGDMYKYKVEVDASNTIEVNVGTANRANEDTSDAPDSEELVEEEEVLDEPTPTRASKPARAATPPNAADQAKVQALLSRGKTRF